MEDKVRVPDMFSFFKIDQSAGRVVRNADGDPEQVLIVSTTAAAKSDEMRKALHVYLLPKKEAAAKDEEAATDEPSGENESEGSDEDSSESRESEAPRLAKPPRSGRRSFEKRETGRPLRYSFRARTNTDPRFQIQR